MSLQIFEIHKFQSTHVSGFDVNLRCHPMIQCLFPAGDTQAPLVAVLQTGEIELGDWRGQIVALGALTPAQCNI